MRPTGSACRFAARRGRPRSTRDQPRAGAADRARCELKPVAIEDLLNRPQVPLDRDGMARLIQGRRVLVTGAGGTIGSELARQVAALRARQRWCCSTTANTRCGRSTWNWPRPTRSRAPQPLIADIRDEARIRAMFEEFRPELVFHAAALKHVPMVEANPLEGLLTNAAGTRHVADAARAAGARWRWC